ncbi:7039_t:CDS:10, partial [Cetraspora pellucida]
MNSQFRRLKNDRSQQHMARLCQDQNYVRKSNLLQTEFCNKIKPNELCELPCAACSGLYCYKNYKEISVNNIDLSLLKALIDFLDPFFEIDFNYKHPYIDNRLTIPKQILISPEYSYMNLIQLTKKKYTHYKLKGHIITFSQNPKLLMNILPLPMYRLTDYLKVVFIGTLQWLFEHNKLFKDKFIIDTNSLNVLPEEDIPEPLLITTTVINITSHEMKHYTDYALNDLLDENCSDNNSDNNNQDLFECNNQVFKNFINNNSINSTSELRPSGILHVDNSNKHVSSEQNKKSVNISTQSHVICVPYIGGHEGRSTCVTLKKYANHLMHYHDPKFWQYRSFQFVLFNVLQHRELQDIKQSIDQIQNNQKISHFAINELLRNINATGSKLIASHQSCAPNLHSPIIMMYAGNEIDIEKLTSDNFPKATERSCLAHLDSSAVAKYFNMVTELIINTLFAYNKENGGIFSAMKNYYCVVEYQDHSTSYCHMLVWLYEALNPIILCNKIKEDIEFQDISYLLPEGEVLTNKMLEAKYAVLKTIIQKRMHLFFMPIPDLKSPNFEENFQQDLLDIAKHMLFHCLNPSRIIFPDQGIIAVQYNNAFINNHNPYKTAACRSNNDIKFIATHKLALAYVYYITDYITKSDLTQASDKTSIDIVNRSHKLVTKCLNKIVGQTELTSPQVSAYLLGINDHYTPNTFVSLHLQSFEDYLMMEWKKHIQNFNKDLDEFNDCSDTNYDQNNQYYKNESFMITFFNNNLTAINLHVNYQFRVHRRKGTERVVVLCNKRVSKITDIENTECYACQTFLDGLAISPCIKSIISNIELLHKCSEETALNRELRKSALDNSILVKACHINCGYDINDQHLFSDIDDDLLDNDTSKITHTFDSSGIGKFKVIQAIDSYFACTLQCHTLYILAPTRIAAANVYRNTIHSACGFEYVILEEISMIGKNLLVQFHAFIKKLKTTDNSVPFAGLNILCVGDFMQLLVVLDTALYMLDNITQINSLNSHYSNNIKPSSISTKKKSAIDPLSINYHSVTNTTEKNLWLNVKHVVILKKPMHQLDDPFYASILERINEGNLTKFQKSALRSKILGDNTISSIDWRDAIFLVPRNDLYVQLNFDATKEHAYYNNQPLIYSYAQDSYNRNILTRNIRNKFLSTPDTKDNALCGILPLSINMKVVITVNVCTNNNLANSSQEILREIVYDDNSVECSHYNDNTIILKSLPKYVIIELIGRTP